MNALGVVALLVYTFGAFAYASILILWAPEVRRRGWASRDSGCAAQSRELQAVNGALLFLSFVWFVCNAAQVVTRFIPGEQPRALDIVAVCLAFAFPPIIMHLTWVETASGRQQQLAGAWRAALWPAYLAAVALPAWALSLLTLAGASAESRQLGGRLLGLGLSGAFLVAAAYSIALIAHYGDRRKPREKQARRWMLGLFGLMVMLFLAIIALTVTRGSTTIAAAVGPIIELAAKSLPLVFIFVGTYFENRFQFFDLFVKRGVSLVVTMAALALIFAVALPLPFLQPIAPRSVAPWIYAAILLPVVSLLPWVHGRIAAVLDRRWLGRRYTTVEAVKHFLASLRSATTEPQLVDRAQAGLEEIFGAPATVVIGGHAAPVMAVAQEVPIRSGDRILGRFFMGPRVSEAPYFSGDVSLLSSLADVFAHVVDNLHLQERKLEQEQLARELSLHASRSELKALRAQINPHFLFNALNSIAGLIHKDPAVADRTIEQLADVFRYALRGAESEWAVLDDEFDFVRAYLDVECARFGERLRTVVRMEDAARRARVPTMMVQTLVENAVKHGVAAVRGPAAVEVTARVESGQLIVSVGDNGPGFQEDAAAPSRTRGGYGLVNIRQRLEGYFGSDGALTIDRDAGRGLTVVSVSLPLTRVEPKGRAEVLR